MKRAKYRAVIVLTIVMVCIHNYSSAQEILLPLGSAFKDQTVLNTDEREIGFTGTGLFPVAEGSVQTPYYLSKDSAQIAPSWFKRKLFQEHFVEIQGEDYFLSIDPLLNVNLGRERGIESHNLFQNTRAFQVSGEVMNKVSFYTGFYENQAKFSSFHTAYFEDRGEKRANGAQTAYNTINAVVPMGGRTKPFKEDELENAFDFAQSMSYVRYRPTKFLALQFGNTPNFIGWGHRSLLLSDNSFNASTLRADVTLSEKWSYSTLFSKHLNLFRRLKGVDNTVEEPYEKKNYSAHYLTFKPTEKLTLGIFEATVFYREDSISSERAHPLFYNPVIGVNSAVFGWEAERAKNLVGLNFAYVVGTKNLLFGQVATDRLGSETEYGLQIGWRSRDLFGVKNLNFHVEYNKSSDRLYAANNWRMAYTHFNLPLAHTLGNGFDEVVGRINYMYKNIYINLHSVLYEANQPMENKSNLFESALLPTEKDRHRVHYNEIEVGYLFNPRTNLRLFSKVVYRTSVGESAGNRNSGLVFIGLKTGLFNQYFDF